MKKMIRLSIGLIVVAPIASLTYLLSLAVGKHKAVKKLGFLVTICAKSLQQFFPPKINNASEFDIFKEKVKPQYAIYKIWSILYDYSVEYPDENSVLLLLRNCPFADALKIFKLDEIGPYMCQGDWEVAKDNSKKWKFERKGAIGKGCEVCDFKYIRIQ